MSSIWRSLPMPQKRILLPGTTSLGALRKARSLSSVQTKPALAIAGEYLKSRWNRPCGRSRCSVADRSRRRGSDCMAAGALGEGSAAGHGVACRVAGHRDEGNGKARVRQGFGRMDIPGSD
jgi:hypothetical protein